MRLRLPKPVKKAFAFVERFDPSTTYMSPTLKLTERAYSNIRSRRSPASRGVNLLKSGMIQVGATNSRTTVIPETAAQQ